jgi:polysaccharide export outer membrane protein
MSTKNQPQSQMVISLTLSYSRVSWTKSKWLMILSLNTILWWLLDLGIFTPVGLSQTSISLPKTEESSVEETLPTGNLENEFICNSSSEATTDSQSQPCLFVPTIQEPNSQGYELETPSPNATTSQEGTSSPLKVYRLATGDGLTITVPQFPEFNAVVSIDGEGNVIIPILGRLSLAGLTLAEVEQKIAYQLGQSLLQEEPEVLAALSAPRPAEITILGEVAKPGFYNFAPGSILTAALQSDGGSTQDADLRSVIVRRPLVDGSIIEEKVDLYTPLIEGKSLPELRLQGGDTIIIPKLEVGEDRHYDRALIARSTLPQQTINVRILAPATTGTTFRNVVLPNGSTFIDAIASLPPDDKLLVKEEVALLRFDPETGGIITQRLNTQDVIYGDLAQNIPLQNEDVIVVSRTLLGKVFNAFNVITQPIRTFFGFQSFFENLLN